MSLKSNKRVRAFIVGDGEERENLKNYTTDLGLDFLNGEFKDGMKASVHFTSWVKEVDWVNAGLDIIALSSLNEGTPVSLIEAQAAGKPILTTKVGGVGDVIKSNKTAMIVPPEDQDLFNKKMIELVEDEKLRLEMGKNGWNFVNKQFHYSRLVNDMKSLYENLLH
ncbi:MAG: glycosyltransferase family 4 protein [Vicingaceae bacterium]